MSSDLGLNPSTSGEVIRVSMPKRKRPKNYVRQARAELNLQEFRAEMRVEMPTLT